MSRKDQLRAALTRKSPELPDGNSAQSLPLDRDGTGAPRALVRSGAVGAMSRSLGQIATAAEEARALVAAGDKVVELDPGLIEASFVTDRLNQVAADHETLVASVRDHGQQVPILVRPHPTAPGRYQVAYGHRRLAAATELRRPVRAVVKRLSDEELVVAQGQENSARTDLSYIERALFAAALEDREFERSVIMAALNVEKTQLSRLLAIARAIPPRIAAAIGPAPKAGRPRWTQLAEALRGREEDARVLALLDSRTFQSADSDARFGLLLTCLLEKRGKASISKRSWEDPTGRPVISIEKTDQATRLTFDEGAAPSFAEFLLTRMGQLHAEYEREGGPAERLSSSSESAERGRARRAGKRSQSARADQS